jgi:hypothetical protein
MSHASNALCLLVPLFFHCSSASECEEQLNATYEQADVDAQIDRIAGRYEDEGGAVALELCPRDLEDVVYATNQCQVSYALQKGGRSERVIEPKCLQSGVPGGCPYGVALPLRASFRREDTLSVDFTDAQLGLDDGASLRRAASFRFGAGFSTVAESATLDVEGTFTLVGPQASGGSTLVLRRVGDASCTPAPR